jgi:hypothetical protein
LRDDSAAIAREQTIGVEGEAGGVSGEKCGLELKMRGVDALLSTMAVPRRSDTSGSMSAERSIEDDGDGRRPISWSGGGRGASCANSGCGGDDGVLERDPLLALTGVTDRTRGSRGEPVEEAIDTKESLDSARATNGGGDRLFLRLPARDSSSSADADADDGDEGIESAWRGIRWGGRWAST